MAKKSVLMIGLWAVGDLGRLVYYVWVRLPLQFVLGAGLACAMDLVVMIQYMLYKQKSMTIEEVGIDSYPVLLLSAKWQGSDFLQKEQFK